jgi:hypothetical protein
MAFHLFGMGAAKADRPNPITARCEGEAAGFAINQAPGAISLLPIGETVVTHDGQHFEISGAGERNAMLGDIGFIFVRIKLNLHNCIYN